MSGSLSIAMAQLNFVVGDVAGNGNKVIAAAVRARDELGCSAIVFPELTLSGYPPEDLLLRPAFLGAVDQELARVCAATSGIAVILGHPRYEDETLYNAASIIKDGRIVATYHKYHLPNYSVFDEKRYFAAGEDPCVVDIEGVWVGVTVCEDVWADGPVERAVAAGAQLIVNLNASPYHIDKATERERIVSARARKNAVAILYTNLIGGQDELVFDGSSFVVDHNGNLTQRCAAFQEQQLPVGFNCGDHCVPEPGVIESIRPVEWSVYEAIVLGVCDYIEKNGFSGAVVGLSGGIDSALTLAIAADAIGAARVEAVMMPSRYTAEMSLQDARAEAQALGVVCHTVSIEPMFKAFVQQLANIYGEVPVDVTEENIQARCRGVLLMAVSNKKRSIVLTTGNKSEMAVGYATLYGDMAGGFAAIKDVPKTLVYRLAEYRNGIAPVIPERVLRRAPSAELAPNQEDADSLPPYDVLDPILEAYIEQDRSPQEIAAQGFDAETVVRVARMVDRNEYKRRQAAPGVRITRRAFGRDRRYPITSGFRS